jgi:hypothetical protein
MEKDIVDGKLGSVGAYDLEFKGGKLAFKVSAGIAGASLSFGVELGADEVLSALENAIPGKIDDAVFDLIKAALKA